jgi:hypothetical protein
LVKEHGIDNDQVFAVPYVPQQFDAGCTTVQQFNVIGESVASLNLFESPDANAFVG